MAHKPVRVVLLAALMLLALGGCSSHLSLTYPSPITPATPAAQGESLALVRFADARKHKATIFSERTSLQFGTPGLKDPGAAGDWVAQAIADELNHAGAKATVVANSSQTEDPTVVTGKLTRLMVYGYGAAFFMRATVKFNLTVTKGGVVVLNKAYSGEASRPYFGPDLVSHADEALAAAMQNAAEPAAKDIIKVIR